MSIGQTYKYSTRRKRLIADTDAFLAAGGVIEHLPYGVKKIDKPSFNSHGKNSLSKK